MCVCVCKTDPPSQLKVLRGVNVPPAVSPLTTRSGKKRKCNENTTAIMVRRGEGGWGEDEEWVGDKGWIGG